MYKSLKQEKARSRYFGQFPYETILDLDMRPPSQLDEDEALAMAGTTTTLTPNTCRDLYGMANFRRIEKERGQNGENQTQSR